MSCAARQPGTSPRRRSLAVVLLAAALAGPLWPSAAARAQDGAPSPDAQTGDAQTGTYAAGPYEDGTYEASESQIKAALLYNFAKLTHWPAAAFRNAREPLRACVLGAGSFGSTLAGLDGKRIGTRRLAIRPLADTDAVAGCHMVFLGGGVDPTSAAALAGLGGRPVLTVADRGAELRGFAPIIRLHLASERLRFQVDAARARGAGLSFSAQLLSLSRPAASAAPGPLRRTRAG